MVGFRRHYTITALSISTAFRQNRTQMINDIKQTRILQFCSKRYTRSTVIVLVGKSVRIGEEGMVSSRPIVNWSGSRTSHSGSRSRLASTGSRERINSSLYCRRCFTTSSSASDAANSASSRRQITDPGTASHLRTTPRYAMVAPI